MIAVTLDEWKKKLEFPTGETVILHNPKVKLKSALIPEAAAAASTPAWLLAICCTCFRMLVSKNTHFIIELIILFYVFLCL